MRPRTKTGEGYMLYSQAMESDLARTKEYYKKILKQKKVLLSIDYSLNGTGIAIVYKNKVHTLRIACSKNCSLDKNKVQFNNPKDRYEYIKDQVFSFLAKYPKPNLIFCEGFSMGSKGRVFDLAEGTGYLLGKLSDNFKVPIYKIPPTRMKKIITNKGNAKKELVSECVRLGCSHSKMFFSDDEYDAIGIMIACFIELENEIFRDQKISLWAD